MLDTLNVVENGTYNAPSGVDGYNPVTVNVQSGGGGKFGIGFNRIALSTKAQTIDLSNLDPSTLTDMGSMFEYCENLTSLDLSHFDTSKVANMVEMFSGCSSLETINCDGLKLPNINLSDIHLDSSPLTVESIVGLLNALPQSTNNYSFQIGADNIAKLSDMQKQIATDKGWKLI